MTCQLLQLTVSSRRPASGVMGFVDDQQIIARSNGHTITTEPLEADEVGHSLCGAECLSPHLRQRCRRDDEPARVRARDRDGDKGLSHADVVAKERAAKLVQRALNS